MMIFICLTGTELSAALRPFIESKISDRFDEIHFHEVATGKFDDNENLTAFESITFGVWVSVEGGGSRLISLFRFTEAELLEALRPLIESKISDRFDAGSFHDANGEFDENDSLTTIDNFTIGVQILEQGGAIG